MLISSLKGSCRQLFALTLVTALILFLWSIPAQALHLANRSVQVQPSSPSAISAHNYQFTYVSVSPVGSVAFLYCDNSPIVTEPCNAPAGLDVNTATLASQSGNVGFSIDGADTTANRLVITRPSVIAAAIASTYDFSNITNPSAAATTIFIRIATYASTDGSGPATDNGSVAFATQSPFNVGADVPPFLSFCVGITVAGDCTTALGNSLQLGTLSSSITSSGQSQFAIGTNDGSGYVIYALGTTMTSGNNAITALNSPTASFPGNSQFGINLRANASPPVGIDPSGVGTGTPTPNYNIPNFYTFNNGDSIADSPLPTDYNRMTVSYVVNVNSGQPIGTYSTTITYVATVQF